MSTLPFAPASREVTRVHENPDAVRRPLAALLIVFAIGNAVAAGVLGAVFGWPAVLGEPASVALPMFAENQAAIVSGFYLFIVLSVLLVPISLGFYRLTASGGSLLAPTVAAFGILAGAFQLMGWIRWPFVVPDLARAFLDPAATTGVRDATASSYELINSYAGAGLGEHLGWLFQAAWGLGIALLMVRTGVLSRTIAMTGGVLTAVWAVPFLLGSAVPVLGDDIVSTAGFVAYALWFVWNGVAGAGLLRRAR